MSTNNSFLYIMMTDYTGMSLICIFLIGFIGLAWVASTFDI